MPTQRRLRFVAVLLLLSLLAVACGQKEGVHVGFAGGGGVGADGQPLVAGDDGAWVDGTGVDSDGDGQVDSLAGGGDGAVADGAGGGGAAAGIGGSGAADGATTAGTVSSVGSGGGSAGGAAGGGGGSSGSGGGGSGGSGGGGDSTGVTKDTITVGIHAPLTGAAPIPQTSFHTGKDQYWNFVGKVYGRDVKVVFRDDKYNPSSASQGCQELILKEKVFILTGAGGTDQIAACARVAAQYGVPYLSAGVTRIGLDKFATYFAQSKSYSDQMPLLFQWIRKNLRLRNKNVGIVASNTANFDDAVSAWKAQAQRNGYKPYVYRPSKAPSDGELAGVAQAMVGDDVSAATPVMQPLAWIKLARNPQLQTVEWAGVGVTMGLNSVARAVCPSADGAMFFSPFPGFNLSDEMDPRFREAGGSDDIQWGQWAANRSLHVVLKRTNGVLTREAFAKALLGSFSTGILPPTSHTEKDHFRVDSVHALHLDCSSQQFISRKSDLFRKSF